MKNFLLSLAAFCISGFVAQAQTIFYSQNFETTAVPAIPSGWAEAHAGGGLGWQTAEGKVFWGSLEVPPHTRYLMVNDAKQPWNDIATITTGTFSMLGATNARLSFACIYGEFWAMEKAWVEISTNGGSTYSVVDTVRTSGVWIPTFMNLSGITPTANCKLRFCYRSPTGSSAMTYQSGLWGIAIDDILVYDGTGTDIGITGIIPEQGLVESYAKIGDSVTFSGYLANYGPTTISGFDVFWQVGSSAPLSQYFSTSCAPFTWNAFTAFSIPYIPAVTGPATIKLWIVAAGDVNNANDTIRTTIVGRTAAATPVKRMFTEEVTGTWCGWCPRGIVYLDSLWNTDSAHLSIICIHSKFHYDAMADENLSTRLYDTLTNKLAGLGYPSTVQDRRRKSAIDEWIFYDLADNKKKFGFAHIGVTHNVADGKITARATIKPSLEMTGDYRLELIVTEEGVSGTTVKYQQANAYSGSSTPMQGSGYNFNDSANIIAPGSIKFRYVARFTIPQDLLRNPNGVPGSLPSVLHTDSFYSYTFDPVTIPSNWKSDRLRCVVALIDNNPLSPNYSYVLNSATTSHPPIPGTPPPSRTVSLNTHNFDLQLFPNPAQGKITISFVLPEDNVTDICIYDMSGRLLSVIATPSTTGRHNVLIPTNELPSGTYTAMLRTGANRVQRQFTVIGTR